MNRYDIKTEILVRSGKTTSSSWLSEAFLNDWINQAHRWAAGFKPWSYTEGRTSTTYTGVEEWNFEGYRADSIRFITIGTEKFQKINFDDYQRMKEDQPENADNFFSDYGGLVYINPYCGVTGTLTAYGQFMPADIPDGDGATADDVETVFSPTGDEGNQAIIEKVLGNIANREQNNNLAVEKYNLANALLQQLWNRQVDEQFSYQTKNRGMWDRIDILDGEKYDDLIKRDQF